MHILVSKVFEQAKQTQISSLLFFSNQQLISKSLDGHGLIHTVVLQRKERFASSKDHLHRN